MDTMNWREIKIAGSLQKVPKRVDVQQTIPVGPWPDVQELDVCPQAFPVQPAIRVAQNHSLVP